MLLPGSGSTARRRRGTHVTTRDARAPASVSLSRLLCCVHTSYVEKCLCARADSAWVERRHRKHSMLTVLMFRGFFVCRAPSVDSTTLPLHHPSVVSPLMLRRFRSEWWPGEDVIRGRSSRCFPRAVQNRTERREGGSEQRRPV